jgi:WD40 repeat protein
MVTCVAFSPDNQRLLTASDDETAKIWNAISGAEIRTHRGPVYSAIFSPNGERIVTGGDLNAAKIWDSATGRDLFELSGHSLTVSSVAYSRDGRRILTGSWDRTAKLWDALTGRELLTLTGHNGPVLSVDFAPDGLSIVTASQDGTARIWRAAEPQQVVAWQKEDATTKRRLANLEREWRADKERAQIVRASDEGRIKRWLILAPIALAAGQSAADGLDFAQIPVEPNLRPAAGEKVSPVKGELRWRETALD